MLKLDFSRSYAMEVWGSQRLGNLTWLPGTAFIGVRDDEDRMRAVVGFNLFTDNSSCCMHVATDGSRAWATRKILAGLFAYPFIQCGLRRVTAPIARRNKAAQILVLKLGFSFEGTLRHAREDDDEVLMGMLREDCPWIGSADHG